MCVICQRLKVIVIKTYVISKQELNHWDSVKCPANLPGVDRLKTTRIITSLLETSLI